MRDGGWELTWWTWWEEWVKVAGLWMGTNLLDMAGSGSQVGGIVWVGANLMEMVGSVGHVGGMV